MRHEHEALAEIEVALRRAVRHLFDAQIEISRAKVALSKADALRKRGMAKQKEYGHGRSR